MGSLPTRERLISDLQFLQCGDLEIWCIGGAARSLITGEHINDIDLVFADARTYDEYERRMRSRKDVDIKNWSGKTRAGNDYIQVTRKSDGQFYDACNWVYAPIEYHIEYNEWLHTAVACDMSGNLILGPGVLEAVQTKSLVPGKSMRFLDFQVKRMYRFINEGWSAPDDLYHTLVRKIQDAPSFEWSPEQGRRGSGKVSVLNPQRVG